MAFQDEVVFDNEVVGYCDGKYIIKDECGELYYLEGEPNLIDIGELVSPDELTPIRKLPKYEELHIRQYFE